MTELQTLRDLALTRGAVGFGIARLADSKTDDFLLPRDLLARLDSGLSIALPLQPAVLATLPGRPNQLYEHHYRQVNFALDRLALELAQRITALGGEALPIPASQIVDWDNQRGHLSHKRVAVAAGLGWLGRNNLLVTPRHGAQVRLVTVLTDLRLEPTRPTDHDCGSCRACIEACPAQAIGETAADFRHLDCFAQLREFQRRHYVSQYICGLCIQACGRI
ncbi:epoxyqueuosine reductase [candidate division WOR-3 bacterium]|nr:epoxyqueuosine reductase [candidate division WOR-3 bacterium]